MTNKEKQITKGEIGNVVGGYPVFELIVDKKLKRVVLLDDVQKFLDKALSSQRKDIVEEIEVEDVKLIQIAPVEFNSIACGRQTNLYGLDDKGRIWVKHYNHWDKWVLSEKDIFIKEETITKEDE